MSILPVLASIVLCAAPAPRDELGGRYRGAIQLPSSALEIEIALEMKNATWAGRISIPAQNLRDMALSDVKVALPDVAFAMAGIPGNPRFSGKADKGTISGTFTQGAGSFPFTIKKLRPQDEAATALKDIDELASRALAELAVPGAAVAVVKDGEVVLVRGWGVRDREKKLPVTGRTLFAVGSTTKAFTTWVMASLVEEGKLDWKQPVRTWLPAFALKDDYAAARMNPRDLVTHLSGMPRHDLSWYNSPTLTRDDVVKRLVHLEPNRSFREEWQYNNMMFLVAGALVEKASGRTWEQNVRDRILVPLKMARTNFSVKESARDADHAEPYADRKDGVEHIAFRDITNAGPAGSINSSVEEMARWMLAHLEGGTVDGRALLPASAVKDLHTPRAVIAAPPDDLSVPLAAYASGWMVDAYRGHRRVHHGGAIDGFIADVELFPDQHLGIVTVANLGGTRLPSALSKTIADRMLQLPARDWLGEAATKRNQARTLAKEAMANKSKVRVEGTSPSRPLEAFAGRYAHPGYGLLDVKLEGGRLVATYNNIRMPLDHWHYDVFRSGEQELEAEFEGLLFNFRTNLEGEVASVETPMEASVADIRFDRQPDARLSDPAFLKGLVGDFDLASHLLKTELRSSVLVLSQDGGATIELVPRRGTSFALKGVNGVTVEFVLDADGKTATELRVSDPNGRVSARRRSK